MPKTREQKKAILQDLTDKIQKAKAVVFVGFQGLKVKDIEELRKICRENGLEYYAAKKTLLKKALDSLGLSPAENEDIFSQEVALVYSYEDEVSGAKIADKFSRSHECLVLKGGILENRLVNLPEIKQLASLPTKEELYAKVVGSIKAPLSGLANVLAGNLRGLVQVLNAIKEQKS